MKVFNLTDVETPTLKAYGLLQQTIVVGKELVLPGASIEVTPKDEPVVRTHLEHFAKAGAVAFDVVPEGYGAKPEAKSEAKRDANPETKPEVTPVELKPAQAPPADEKIEEVAEPTLPSDPTSKVWTAKPSLSGA